MNDHAFRTHTHIHTHMDKTTYSLFGRFRPKTWIYSSLAPKRALLANDNTKLFQIFSQKIKTARKPKSHVLKITVAQVINESHLFISISIANAIPFVHFSLRFTHARSLHSELVNSEVVFCVKTQHTNGKWKSEKICELWIPMDFNWNEATNPIEKSIQRIPKFEFGFKFVFTHTQIWTVYIGNGHGHSFPNLKSNKHWKNI